MPVLTEELARLRGHRWQISCLNFSPDGSRLVSSGWDKEANIWDLSNLEVVLTLKGVHRVPVTTVSWYRPSGQLICTGSADNTAALWDAESGRHLSSLSGHFGWVLGSCFAPTGNFLATASWDKTVRIWDPGSQTLINTLSGHNAGVWSVDFHPRSSLLCSASEDGTIKLWDARSSRIVRTFSGGHRDAVYCVNWSPDGAMIASGSADSKVCVWEPRQGALINTIYGHMDTVKSVSFNPQTENVSVPVLASAGDFTVRLSDPRPERKADILTLSPHSLGKEVEAVTISPDGSLLVSGGRDGIIVLMTLLVPSIMPRSDSILSTSSVLRRSRVVRDRSYIYDVTDGGVPPEIDEEEDIEAELELEALDKILTEPKKVERQTSFTRLKRRSRIGEKELELPPATVKRKNISARQARGKRIKEKLVDIPTMVAHLSAAIRAYGPEDPSSSSESEEEEEKEKQEGREDSKPKVDVISKVMAFSHPETLGSPMPKQSAPLPAGIGKLKDRRGVFEKQGSDEQQEQGGDALAEKTEQEYLQSNRRISLSQVMPQAELRLDDSMNFDAYSVGTSEYFDSSLRFAGVSPGDSMEDKEGFVTSSPLHTSADHKRKGFSPTLPPQVEFDEEVFTEDNDSGDEYYGDDVPLTEI